MKWYRPLVFTPALMLVTIPLASHFDHGLRSSLPGVLQKSTGSKSILSHPLSNMALLNLWNGSRYHYLEVPAASVATLFAPILAIVSQCPAVRHAAVQILDMWISSSILVQDNRNPLQILLLL